MFRNSPVSFLFFSLFLFFLTVPFLHPWLNNGEKNVYTLSLTGLLLLGSLLSFKESRLEEKPLLLSFLSLSAFVAFSGVSLSFSRYTHYNEAFNHYLHQVVSFFIFTTALFCTTPRIRERIMLLLIAGGSLIALFGILQHFGINIIPRDPYHHRRITSTFSNPNDFAGYLLLLYPLCFFLHLRNNLTGKSPFPFFLCGFLIFTGIILSSSRGVWFALFFLILLLFVIHRKMKEKSPLRGKRRTIRKYSVMMLTIIILFSIPSQYTSVAGKLFTDRLKESVDIFTPALLRLNNWAEEHGKTTLKEVLPPAPEKGGSVYHRYFLWSIALEMTKEHPLTGSGYGSFGEHLFEYEEKLFQKPENFTLLTTGQKTEPNPHAHNEILNIAAETGLPSLFLFLFFWYLYGKNFRRQISIIQTEEKKLLLFASFFSIAGVLIYAMVSYPLRVPVTMYGFWFSAGVTLASYEKTKEA